LNLPDGRRRKGYAENNMGGALAELAVTNALFRSGAGGRVRLRREQHNGGGERESFQHGFAELP
jgi:hypothetical protein